MTLMAVCDSDCAIVNIVKKNLGKFTSVTNTCHRDELRLT
jgi:hypothetical protein